MNRDERRNRNKIQNAERQILQQLSDGPLPAKELITTPAAIKSVALSRLQRQGEIIYLRSLTPGKSRWKRK